MKIVLDPGHSGPFEPGACAAGFTEAELVLSIARRIRRRLLAAGHEVRLTRSGDIDDDGLSWRTELSNRWNADRFLSIHANSFSDTAARGNRSLALSRQRAWRSAGPQHPDEHRRPLAYGGPRRQGRQLSGAARHRLPGRSHRNRFYLESLGPGPAHQSRIPRGTGHAPWLRAWAPFPGRSPCPVFLHRFRCFE